jgi:predicted adenylyl cyclase CyaB
MANEWKEIEIKLDYKSKKLVIARLKEIGALFCHKAYLEDRYFGLPGTTMSNRNNLLRIRREGKSSELTFKVDCKDKANVWERREMTVKIDSPDVMEEILKNLGFVKLSENKSRREAWSIGRTEAVFISFISPEKMTMLEIEGPEPKMIKKIVARLKGSVWEIGEKSFKRFDDSRKVL